MKSTASPLPASTPRSALSRATKRHVWSMTDGHCFYCGIPTNPFATFTIDHIVPLSRGGTDAPANLVPCCHRCNCAKGTKLLSEWKPSRPFWFESDDYIEHYESIHRFTIFDWETEDLIEASDEDGE